MDEIKEITPVEVENKINRESDIHIIDVREDSEVANGMIPTAEHIPMNNIPQELDRLDKDKEYILVCRSGKRSWNVAGYMQQEGFKVRNMTGGMLEWDGELVF